MSQTVDAGLLRTMPLPSLGPRGDKDTRGRVLVVAGGAEVPGAALLTGEAALRVGAGNLQFAATERFALALAMAMPEARVLTVAGEGDFSPEAAEALTEAARRCDAVLIGPGMIDDAAAGALTARIMEGAPDSAYLLDAAAMTALRQDGRAARAAGRLVLTPHPGEMAALSGASLEDVLADPAAAARAAAARFQAVVALKSRDTWIVTPDGRAWIHRGGAVGLGTGGSGDVLAGAIGGLMARGAAPVEAALWGVWLHGQAGERLGERIGPMGFLAREILGELPRVLAETGPPP
jgi:ADP-dependent NAD(P)H-hydrate dehydratase